MRSLRTIVLTALAAALVVALAACGSSGRKSKNASGSPGTAEGGPNPGTEPLTGGKKGGVLSVAQTEDYEHLDPGLSYFQLDYEIASASQRAMYSYKPNTFSVVTPDMAEGQPQFSNANKLITIKIRKGVHFSPPVNREVTAEDEVYAIDRVANPNVANPYYLGYLSAVEGMKTAKG